MSWTLFRYIASETSFSFFVSFLFFFFIFFVNQLLLMAEDILSKRAPPFQVALLIFYSLPAIVAMAAPFASLVGTLMAIGRISSDNEILVIRSSGLAYHSVYLPVILIGFLVSLGSFFANDVLLPAGTLEFGKLYRKLLISTPAMELESNSVKRYKDTVLVTGSVEDSTIHDLLIFDRTSVGERRLIVASAAQLDKNSENELSLDLSNAFMHTAKENVRGDYDYAFAKVLRYSIQQKDLMQAVGDPGPREMSSRDVAKEIAKKYMYSLEKADSLRRKAFEDAYRLEGALRGGPAEPLWNEKESALSNLKLDTSQIQDALNDRNLRVYRLEYYKKFSIPFGALSFVFLATPLGLFAKKSGQSMGFGLGLIIAVVYWALLIGGQTLGVRLGYSPFWAMWLPNIAAITLGLFLSFLRILR
ncbi:LptF/LptG family permease [Treponema sp.]